MKRRINHFASVALVSIGLLFVLSLWLTLPAAAWLMWQTGEKGGSVICALVGVVLALIVIQFATTDFDPYD